MNINNWLCKHFDDEKKGYVTISDVMPCIVLLFLLVLSIYSIGRFFFAGGYNQPPKEELSFELLGGIITTFAIAILFIALLFCIVEVIRYISNIRIAKCPLKEKEESRQEEREGE